MKPVVMWITTNRQCNFHCPWCYAQDTKYTSKDKMPFELACNLLSIARELEIRNLLLIGGEPTLWKPLIDFNKLAIGYGMHTTLITNAFRFSNDKFWYNYNQYPNSTIGISLKASNPVLFRQIADVEFSKMKLGLVRAINHNYKGIPMAVSITYNTYYEDNLIKIAEFAISCGTKKVKIDFASTVFINSKAVNKFMVPPEKLVRNIVRDYSELMRITSNSVSFEMNTPLCIWPEDFIDMLIERNQITTVCHLIRKKGLIFDVDGKLIMCNGLFDFPIGQYDSSFRDAGSLLDYINRPEIQNIYDKIRCYPSEECIDCKLYNLCGGGCPIKWAIYNPAAICKRR